MITKFCVASLICGVLGAISTLFGGRESAADEQASLCADPSGQCPQQIAMANVSAGHFFAMLARR